LGRVVGFRSKGRGRRRKVYPITARKGFYPSRNIYLGKTVRDREPRGFSSITEVEDTCNAILQDYWYGRISYTKASRRINYMDRIVDRDSDFTGMKLKRAHRVISTYKKRLKELKADRDRVWRSGAANPQV